MLHLLLLKLTRSFTNLVGGDLRTKVISSLRRDRFRYRFLIMFTAFLFNEHLLIFNSFRLSLRFIFGYLFNRKIEFCICLPAFKLTKPWRINMGYFTLLIFHSLKLWTIRLLWPLVWFSINHSKHLLTHALHKLFFWFVRRLLFAWFLLIFYTFYSRKIDTMLLALI